MREPWTAWDGIMFFTLVLLSALIVTAVLLVLPSFLWAHSAEVSVCFNRGEYVEPGASQAHANGLWAELYKGPKAVVQVFSPITGYQYNWSKTGEDDLVVEHGEHPLLYWVDFDKDGRFDEAFIDKGGVGRCGDIEHYLYLNGGGELDENNPRKETKW